MRLNYETCIVGEKCVLVPYRPEHVETYHEWMKDPHLLEATGSEPLSLKDEIAMQQSWRNDPDKCTFIVLSREACDFVDDKSDFVTRNVHAMAGDVNLFLSKEEEEPTKDTTAEKHSNNDSRKLQAELDIMIADKRYLRKGLGREASCLMMMYGVKHLGIRRFFCKINEDNHASRALFEKKLGFQQCDYAECFRQVELERRFDERDIMEDALKETCGCTWRTFSCPIREEEIQQTDS